MYALRVHLVFKPKMAPLLWGISALGQDQEVSTSVSVPVVSLIQKRWEQVHPLSSLLGNFNPAAAVSMGTHCSPEVMSCDVIVSCDITPLLPHRAGWGFFTQGKISPTSKDIASFLLTCNAYSADQDWAIFPENKHGDNQVNESGFFFWPNQYECTYLYEGELK